MSTSPKKTNPSATSEEAPSASSTDPLQIPGHPEHVDPTDTASVTTGGSLVASSQASAELATIDLDDGFSESVPFQALTLKINRSKGHFVLDGDADERSEVYLVPRGSQSSKSYFGLPYDPKNPHDPSCQSPDGKVGFGWIDVQNQDDIRARSCMSCPRRGYGAGTCDDHQTLLAYDVEKKVPVLISFKNAEINPRRGVFTLAVNRMRMLGARATDCVFKLSFSPTDGPYFAVQIDVTKVSDKDVIPADEHAQIAALLDSAWASFKAAANAEAGSLGAELAAA